MVACNASGCSAASNTVSVAVLIPPAWVTAPTQVAPAYPSPITWSAVSGATSYTVRLTNLDTGQVTTPYGGSATSTHVGISVPDTYQFAVQACYGSSCSGWVNAPNVTNVVSSKNNTVPAVTPASGSSP